MPFTGDFALVCEGVTDFAVLKNILIGFFKGREREPLVQQWQPDEDATGADEWQKFGNWEHVFRYLREGKHREALQFNRHLIVQVDTDASEHENFGIPQQVAGQQLEPEEMASLVAGKLRELIGEEDCAGYGDRLLFAICVRDLECWLLPLWENDNKAQKTTGCLNTLNTALARKNQPTINPHDKKTLPYDNASKGYKKRNTLLNEGSKNPSLKLFLDELISRNITLSEEA